MTKDNDRSVREIPCLLAISLYNSVALNEFTLLYRFKFGNKSNLLFLGIFLFIYFPESTPNPRGEYANNPTDSLLHISELPTSNNLFNKE